jgi:hypothetical protein
MRLLGWTVLVLVGCRATPPPAPGVEAWPVVRGSIGGDPLLWYVAFSADQGSTLCPLEESDWPGCRSLDGLSLSELKAMDAGVWSPHSTFFLTDRVLGTVPHALLADATYVESVVAGSKARARERWPDPDVSRVVSELSPFDYQRWAEAHRSDDAWYQRFQGHQAIGTCSMDDTPQRATRLFAELAFARQDFPTFVDLQLQLIENHFARVAWSSFAEERDQTFVTALFEHGVDVDRLLLGLVTQYPGTRSAPDDWRLARAIREARRTEALLPKLESLMTTPELDAYNRFRATEVWLHLQVFDEATRAESLEAVKARARTFALHPLSRSRIEGER